VEQPRQLERYAEALERRGCPGTLVALAEADDDILSDAREHGLATPLTWQEVLDACIEVADGRSEGEWREQARSADALARQRTLAEFCWYLEHRGLAVNIEAMSEADVVAACRAERLLVDGGSIDQLLAAASTGIPGFQVEERYRAPGTHGRLLALERGVTLKADPPGGFWPLRQEEAWPELWFNTTGTRELDNEVEEEPAFFGGFSFDVSRAPHVTDALTDPNWIGKPEGVLLGRGDPYVWIVRMKTLRELANAGGSFSEQSETLRAWCEESLRLIGEAQPPPTWPTPSRSTDRPPD